jgi:hypothetical protein
VLTTARNVGTQVDPASTLVEDMPTRDAGYGYFRPVRWSIRENGGEPSSRQVDELLERARRE